MATAGESMREPRRTRMRHGTRDGAARTGVPAHPLAWLALALVLAAVSTFALTCAFSDGSVFLSPTKTIEDVVSYAYARGPVTVSLTYAATALVSVAGMARFLRADARTRAWSAALGLVLSLTLVFDKHPTSHTADAIDAIVTEPAVWPGQITPTYWAYHGLRFVGFLALMTAFGVLFLTTASAWLDRRASTARATAGEAPSRATAAGRTNTEGTRDTDEEPRSREADGTAADGTHGSGDSPVPHDTASSATRSLLMAATARMASLAPRARRLFSTFTPRHVCALWGGLTVCWLPWMVLLWPANLLSDTVAQIMWWRTRHDLAAWDPSSALALPGYAMSDQHPWLDTLIYGVVDELGVRLGAEAWTLWTFAVLQTVLCALAFAIMLVHLGALMRVPWQACVAMAVFVAVNPLFPRLMMTLVKDSTSMPFFLLLMTMTMEYIRRAHARERLGWALPLSMGAATVMCDLTRKIALEILAGTFLVLAIVLTGRRLASLLLAIVPVVLMTGISTVTMPALHAAPGGKQEMLAIPLQQSALLLVRHGGDLPDADRKALEAAFQCDVGQMAGYLHQQPGDELMIDRGDIIKDACFNRNATNAQLRTFLVTWARQAPTHLGDYIDAVPWLRDPFVMGDWYNEDWAVRAGWETKGTVQTILPEYKVADDGTSPISAPQRIGKAIYMAATSLPPTALFMRENTYAVWVPMAALALCGVRRRYRDWTYLTPWLLTIGSLALLPGHQSRYTWTLAYGAIMVAAIPLIGGRDAERKPVAEGIAVDSSDTNGPTVLPPHPDGRPIPAHLPESQ